MCENIPKNTIDLRELQDLSSQIDRLTLDLNALYQYNSNM